ncbi:MAG: hypothetical protein RQ741_05300 [Wenzhouxiangellaceae bacterium]|nr:hypothetical protein [Wenzhouxiangellaceae bacterium]
MRSRRLSNLIIAGIAVVCTSIPGLAHESRDDALAGSARVLGQIDFPTSTDSKAAQEAFISGMLLLHLFEYPYAEAEFRRAREIDPGFAMAYWGEAMTHNHPIWDEQNIGKARAVLAELGDTPEQRQATTSSQKERDYLGALEILYGDGAKDERDQAYMRQMRAMSQRYPDDHEVQLFHALSLFGVHAGVRDVPAYIEAAAIAQRVFYANRQHPGAAHYFIHGVDDPVHAPLALEAARALAQMAPDAGHSLHMTSHIFIALGLWSDMVEANVKAVAASNRMAGERGGSARSWGHYNFWLLYGLLQQDRRDDARKLLLDARKGLQAVNAVPVDPLELDPDRSHVGSVVQMWARYMIETRGADKAIGDWNFETGDAFDPALNFHYVHGLLASDAATVIEHQRAFQSLKRDLRAAVLESHRQAPSELLYLDRLDVIDHQLQAALARAQGKLEPAIEQAVQANRLEAEMPHSFGPPFVDFPSAELLAQLLLEAGRFDEAAEAYALQLERTRARLQALLGQAEAERRRGNTDRAEQAMEQVRTMTEAPKP